MNLLPLLLEQRSTGKVLIQHIQNKMGYQYDDQAENRLWAGEYCGRCNAKSRSYEGGQCPCDDEIERIQYNIEKLTNLFFMETAQIYGFSDPEIDLECGPSDFQLKCQKFFAIFLLNKIRDFPNTLLELVAMYYMSEPENENKFDL